MAAVLAVLTLESVTSGTESDAAAWRDRVMDAIRQHVMVSVAGEKTPDTLGSAWWNEAFGQAFVQFVQHNDLGPSINRHIAALRAAGSSHRSES